MIHNLRTELFINGTATLHYGTRTCGRRSSPLKAKSLIARLTLEWNMDLRLSSLLRLLLPSDPLPDSRKRPRLEGTITLDVDPSTD